MSLESKVQEAMKNAMRAKESDKLRALRAIKSAVLMAKTEQGQAIDETQEIKLLQKLAKQRRESLETYEQQNREDLAQDERQELEVIESFLPQPLSDAELEEIVKAIISETGASTKADMGKVMGLATQKVAGRADGKRISSMAAKFLS